LPGTAQKKKKNLVETHRIRNATLAMNSAMREEIALKKQLVEMIILIQNVTHVVKWVTCQENAQTRKPEVVLAEVQVNVEVAVEVNVATSVDRPVTNATRLVI